MNLIDKINNILKSPPIKKTDLSNLCFSVEDTMVCYCGKCKQEDCELPEDFKNLIAVESLKFISEHPLVKYYKNRV